MLQAHPCFRSPCSERMPGTFEGDSLDSSLLEDCVEGFVEALKVVDGDISRQDVSRTKPPSAGGPELKFRRSDQLPPYK